MTADVRIIAERLSPVMQCDYLTAGLLSATVENEAISTLGGASTIATRTA